MKQIQPAPKTGQLKQVENSVFDLREKMQGLLEAQFSKVVEDFEKLKPKDRINLWLKLAEFNAPRMRHIEQDIVKVLYRVDGIPEHVIEIEE